jgi:hypothetical protein
MTTTRFVIANPLRQRVRKWWRLNSAPKALVKFQFQIVNRMKDIQKAPVDDEVVDWFVRFAIRADCPC